MSDKMSRGVSQSLYKYLPDCWIDFSVRGEKRQNYIAKVVRWNSDQLDNINKSRLLRIVNQKVDQFAEKATTGGYTKIRPTSGFGSSLTEDNCKVLIPKYNTEERGIVAELDPLSFFCPDCHKVYQFTSKENFDKFHGRCICGDQLKQIRLVYYCKCGWSSSKHNVYCSGCKSNKNIRWSGGINDYNFYCSKCHRSIPMRVKCKQCEEMITPKVALDSSQYYSKTFDLIDIIDAKNESFISHTDHGPYLIIANWLGMVSNDDLEKAIDLGELPGSEEYDSIYTEAYNFIKNTLGSAIAEEEIIKLAKAQADKQCGSSFTTTINSLKAKLFSSEEDCVSVAEEIMEFLRMGELKDCSSLNDAVHTAKLLNTSADPNNFLNIAAQKGIKQAKVYGNIPFITCAYGYTRVKSEPGEGVQLRAFVEEKPGTKNVYAAKLKTEGVLFEFDRKKVLEWLLENEYISNDVQLDLNDEAEIKLWFINNIKKSVIQPYDQIDVTAVKETYYVYNLIHSISHVLIKSAAAMCGLSKDSLSEYIMPNIPAVLIYCQNSQGFNLGALYNLFEAYFDKWLLEAKAVAEKCIFDPICIERYKACGGCLFLNEISCQHFNHDLNRTFVVGHYDRKNKQQIRGFWES